MHTEPGLYKLPESLEKERFVIATYCCITKSNTNILDFAAALAVEQSTGTWLKVPAETADLIDRFSGKVIGIYEAPAYQVGIPQDISERNLIIRIAYPWKNFGTVFSMMLSTVIGNISAVGKVKLVDLEFPGSFVSDFKGPKFGVQGIRELLGVFGRPLLNNMIKPCTGLNARETAKLAYEVAVGGVDIIKDDELVADAPHCRLKDRVKEVMKALKSADEEKGEKTLYAFNITDRTEKLKNNAYCAIENGANALMVNYATIGLDSARMLAEDENINVPILAHPDFTGAMYESEWSGLSTSLVIGKLPRLAGLDMAIIQSPYGKFPMLEDIFIVSVLQMLLPMHQIKPVFPMPGGGTTPGHVEDIVRKIGNDVIIAAGGAIHGHPMGATAGARAFRQAIDGVIKGQTLEETGKQYAELEAALKAWGIYSKKNAGIYALKS